MSGIPLPALALGLAGLVPFAYGVLMIFSAAGTWPTLGLFPSDPQGGVVMLERFGAAVLAFMGGCIAPRARRCPIRTVTGCSRGST